MFFCYNGWSSELLLYEELLSANKDIPSELQEKKNDNTSNLMLALDLNDDQIFSSVSLKRFKLLQDVARGEKITTSRALYAKSLLSKHRDIQPFLGVHPKGHLFLSVPMTKQSLEDIEPLVSHYEHFEFKVGT